MDGPHPTQRLPIPRQLTILGDHLVQGLIRIYAGSQTLLSLKWRKHKRSSKQGLSKTYRLFQSFNSTLSDNHVTFHTIHLQVGLNFYKNSMALSVSVCISGQADIKLPTFAMFALFNLHHSLKGLTFSEPIFTKVCIFLHYSLQNSFTSNYNVSEDFVRFKIKTSTKLLISINSSPP